MGGVGIDTRPGVFTFKDEKLGRIDPGKKLQVCKATFSLGSQGQFSAALIVTAAPNQPRFIVHLVNVT
jgi:hypothetical protein